MKRILLVLSAILITHNVFSQLPTSNLQAWYPFCADTLDHSSHGVSLIDTGAGTSAPVLSTDRFGIPNGAFEFNGASSMMRTTSYFSASGDFTYSCWMYARSSQSSSIIYEGNATANGFGFVMTNGTIGAAGNQVGVLFGNKALHLSTAITLNSWHSLALTRSGNSYTFYIDNVSAGTFVDYFYPLTSFDVFNVGYNFATHSLGFNGFIDDIAVYNEALRTSDLLALYNFNPDITPFTLGNDTAICTTSLVLAPSAQTIGGQYTWGTGTTTIGTDTTQVVTPPDFPGQSYWLTITKPYGCTASDTISVRHITTGINIGPRNATYCAGTPITLGTPVTGETYMWSTGATTGTITVTAAGDYSVIVDSMGCRGVDTITITLTPQPVVDLGPDTASCNGAAITLSSSVTYSPTATYSWDIIPALTPTATTAMYTATVTGNYQLTVTDGGCSAKDTINVIIVTDTFTFSMHDTAICSGKSVATRVTRNPILSYQWRPTTGLPTSNVANPTITTTLSATYVLTASTPGCPNQVDSFHLDVQPNPIVAYFGPQRSVCTGDTVHATAVVDPSSYTGYIFSWSPGKSLVDSTTQTVVFTAGDSTSLVVTVSTSAGCFGKDSIQINVHPVGFDSLVYIPRSICPGDSIQVNQYTKNWGVYAGTIATYQYFPDLYVGEVTSGSPWLHPITSQSYTSVATSQYGCADTVSFNVVVNPAAVIYLGDSVTIYPGNSYQISPQTNCTYFSWSPEIGLNDTNISNPIATPAVSTEYIVRGTTEWGCVTTDSIRIHVSNATSITIPNAFTPGAGINNVLKIIKNGLVSINYFRIYDRWGNLVYESNNIDAGWDGTYKGKDQPFAVYIYEIEAITNTRKTIKQQGNITLIR